MYFFLLIFKKFHVSLVVGPFIIHRIFSNKFIKLIEFFNNERKCESDKKTLLFTLFVKLKHIHYIHTQKCNPGLYVKIQIELKLNSTSFFTHRHVASSEACWKY